ncbi:SDR family NAD(P)-dependent oxidoreductase [Spongisporangium articulatum]|uniref:SDR family NAD(P)-dependent oxidoreductase n=1 Tax=Spongisporangium articulatum TaxID=3362603 RepID=A0ABW8ALX6_9ACTN
MTAHPTIEQLVGLEGRTAVVTGAAMGIGLAVATRLAEAGAGVVLADVEAEAVAGAAKELTDAGLRVAEFCGDVSDPGAAQEMVATAVRTFGGLDVLVNNAGIYPNLSMLEITPDQFDRVLAVNLRGVHLATQAAARQMITQGRGGRIVNVTSIDALHPSSIGLAAYDASKHGVWGYTKNTALELAPHRIWVNALAPGGVATPGVQQSTAAMGAVDLEQLMAAFTARIPMGRLGEPDDIARAALFLASDLSSYVTGAQLVVDGGVLLR